MKKPVLKKSVLNVTAKALVIGGIVIAGLGTLSGFAAFTVASQALKANEGEEVLEEKENFATSPAASTYANKFLKEYFTWDIGDSEGRQKRLAPFLMPDIDKTAGLYIEKETKSSKFHSSELWKVEETGENTSLITFKVLHTLHYVEEKKVKKKTVKNEVSKGPYEKWIQVTIITDGTNFKVNGLPVITSKPADPIFDNEKKESKKLKEASGTVKEEVTAFLPTFFKQYTGGEIEQLNYLTEDDFLKPLDGVISFVELREVKVQESKGEYIVTVSALFMDTNTKALMLQNYEMVLIQKDGRWLVKKMNDTQGGN